MEQENILTQQELMKVFGGEIQDPNTTFNIGDDEE